MSEQNDRNLPELKNLESFLARVGCDMRAQMDEVIAGLDLASHEELPLRAAENVQKARMASEQVITIMDDILDLASIGSGRSDESDSVYCFGEILPNLKKKFEKRIDPEKVSIVTTVDKSIPYRLLGDGRHVIRSLEKLILNAIQATEKGEIKISAKRLPSSAGTVLLRFDISDSGSGVLSGDLLAMLQGNSFEMISDNAPVDINTIYMYVVRYYAARLGGKLSVHCRHSVGSTFTFLLSQKAVGEATVGDYEEEYVPSGEERIPFNAPTAKVLVYDGAETVKETVAALFKYKIKPDYTSSAPQAKTLAGLSSYNLIVTGPSADEKEKESLKADGIETLCYAKGDELFAEQLAQLLPAECVEKCSNGEFNFAEFLEGQGIDYNYAIQNFNNDEEEFRDVLKTLCRTSDTKTKMLRYYLEQHDYKNYIVAVHGIFGVAKMIGAGRLAQRTMELEKAARQGMREIIENETEAATEAFENLLSAIQGAIIPKEDHTIKGVIDKQDLVSLIMELKGYLDDYQLNEVEELFFTLAQYSYQDEEVVRLIHCAEECMINYDYNGVHEVLDKILLQLDKS